MFEAGLQANRLQALAESALMFAEATTDLLRLLGLVARVVPVSDLVIGGAMRDTAAGHPAPRVSG